MGKLKKSTKNEEEETTSEEDIEIEDISESEDDEAAKKTAKKPKSAKKSKDDVKSTPPKKKRKISKKNDENDGYDEEYSPKSKKTTKSPKKSPAKSRKRKRDEDEENEDDLDEGTPKKAVIVKDAAKLGILPQKKAIDSELLEKQNFVLMCGSHVSGGAQAKKAILDCELIRNGIGENKKFVGHIFALFIDTPRAWTFEKNKQLTEKDIEEFNKLCESNQIDKEKNVIPHGSYLINLCAPNTTTLEKSKKQFNHEMERCLKFGIKRYNIHPGVVSKGIQSHSEGHKKVAQTINEILEPIVKKCPDFILLLENTSGGPTALGSSFESLKEIYDNIKDDLKKNIGFTFDTCHGYSAGYDLATKKGYEETWQKFDKILGLQNLKAMHLNDSKAEFDSKKDRHENLGLGTLGENFFKMLVNDKKLENVPKILETPGNLSHVDEINYLLSLKE